MNLGPLEIGLIILAVLLLFGYKKLPDASRSLGRSMRIFKGEMKGMKDDDTRTAAAPSAAPTVAPSSPAQLDAADRDRRAQLEAEAAAAEARAAELRARAARPGVVDPR